MLHIKNLADGLKNELIATRRHLHAHPERSFKEYETTQFIQKKLTDWGFSNFQFLDKTGLVLTLKSAKNADKAVVALRADIDALPILETNKVDYCSQNEGIMHACGHDAHTTCLLGAARILQQTAHEWEGTIKLIFQAGEEENPGGASILVKNGVLENPQPAAIFALHVDTELEAGTIGVCSGLAMASADEIYIEIKGKGGHGARPHECVDTVLVTAQIVQNLQQIVSRRANPLMPTVLTIGKIYSEGGATNIIPEKVFLNGTLRTFDEQWRLKAHELIQQIVENTAAASGASALVEIDKGSPTVYNNPDLCAESSLWAADYLGKENILTIPPRMGAEDFGFYSQQIPAFFLRLGTKIPNGTGLHTPTFNINEEALPIGAGLLAHLAVEKLKKLAKS
jgi:amidohydrolase